MSIAHIFGKHSFSDTLSSYMNIHHGGFGEMGDGVCVPSVHPGKARAGAAPEALVSAPSIYSFCAEARQLPWVKSISSSYAASDGG